MLFCRSISKLARPAGKGSQRYTSSPKLAPCSIKYHVMEAGAIVAGRRKGKERKGGRDSERRGYYTFFIKFPSTKPHQSLSEIEGGGEKSRHRIF